MTTPLTSPHTSSTTNAPPLLPRSPADIESFVALDSSLRQHPELAKEGETILNPVNLAKLVDGIRRFQEDHLGRKSKTKYYPLLRLPTPLLHDRSRSGPLYTILLSAFRTKSTLSSYRNFNFDNPKLFDDNILLLKRAAEDLKNAGYIAPPRIYFDESVRVGLGEGGLMKLEKIVEKFGGVVVRDGKEEVRNKLFSTSKGSGGIGGTTSGGGGGGSDVMSGGITHIVGYDPEEHDAKEVIEDEERIEKSGEELEKAYLRTIGVVDMDVIVEEAGSDGGEGDKAKKEGGGGGGNDTGKAAKAIRKKMALVHWWYFPSSYDEWLPAEDVAGDTETEPPVFPPGVAVVGCKFVRDVEKFNEWGVESDYAVIEYERKLAIFQEEPTNKSSSSSNKSNKKRKKGDNKSPNANIVNEADVSRNPDKPPSETTIEPSTKKNKGDSSDNTDDARPTTTAAATTEPMENEDNNLMLAMDIPAEESTPNAIIKPPSPSKKVSKSKPTEPLSPQQQQTQQQQQQQQHRLTSDRRRYGVGGMNPRRIHTGVMGSRGESIRRTVYDGALRVSDDAYMIVRDALADFLLGGCGNANQASSSSSLSTPLLGARPEMRKLLPAMALVRPSMDTSLTSGMSVMEITVPGPEATKASAVTKKVPILIPEAIKVENAGGGEEPMRIRGGGGDDNDDGMEGMGELDPLPNPEEGMDAVEMMDLAPVDDAVEGGVDVAATGADNVASTNSEGETMGTEQPPAPADVPTDVPADAPAVNAISNFDAVGNNSVTPAETEDQNSNQNDSTAAMQVEQPLGTENQTDEAKADESSGVETAPDTGKIVATATDETVPNNDDAGDETAKSNEDANNTIHNHHDGQINSAAEEQKEQEPSNVGSNEGVTNTPTNYNEPYSADNTSPAAEEAATSEAKDAPQAKPDAEVPPLLSNEKAPNAPEDQDTSTNTTTNTTAMGTAEKPPTEAATNPTIAEEKSETAVKNEPETPIPAVSEIVPLPSNHQLTASLYHSSNAAHAEEGASSSVANLPSWYDKSTVSEFEQRTLPEWFNGSAPHRDATTYIETREKIMEIAKRNSHQFITATALRRTIAGDAGSLMRMHKFLTDWGLLNHEVVGDSTPSEPGLRGLRAAWRTGSKDEKKRPFSELENSMFWSPARIQKLESSVMRHISKSKVATPDGQLQSDYSVNWTSVANEIGGKVTALDCQRAFLEPPSRDCDVPTSVASSGGESLRGMLNNVRPEVLQASIDASLKATQDLTEAKKAALVGAIAGAAAERGVAEEREIERTLMDIVDQRMQRLENRVALIDDVEALLEAERVALELERRDFYTSRCRHWFGDGSA